jgi:hypothetical protein
VALADLLEDARALRGIVEALDHRVHASRLGHCGTVASRPFPLAT